MSMPALIVIGFWFILQLFSGAGSIARTDETADAGGVAYMAHVGGFAAGLAIAFLFGGRGGPPRTV
jgi:membrane associated rhomboid family serine protease